VARVELAPEFYYKAVPLLTTHVYRLADSGAMPPPVKLGALVRWSRQAIEQWIAGGCKPCQTAGKGGRQ